MAKVKPPVRDAAEFPSDPVLEARARARRRLVGAGILLTLGLVTFPIIFQTQPRPVALDIPIVMADPEANAPVVSNEAKSSSIVSEPQQPPHEPEVRDQADAPTKTLQERIKKPVNEPANETLKETLKEKPKFVVQAGAYADPKLVREWRRKIEALGLKTYTQVIDVKGEKRTRIRIGPFTTREDAAKVQKKLKTLGVSPALLAI
jgi:DedD protein